MKSMSACQHVSILCNRTHTPKTITCHYHRITCLYRRITPCYLATTACYHLIGGKSPYKKRYAANAADFSHARRRYQQRPLLIKDTAAADSREIDSLPAPTSLTPCE